MRINGQIVKWRSLGEGGFNKTAVSEEPFELTIDGVSYYQHWVIKKPKAFRTEELSQKMNAPARAVRIWNSLHPNTPAIECQEMRGWLAPYKGSVEATDEEVAMQQLEDYRIHRRVFADACGYKNYLNVDGQIECIDVDVSRHRDSPIGQRIDKEVIEFGQKGSVYNPYWREYMHKYKMPKAVQMTKTLLYLEQKLEANDILDEYLVPEVMNELHDFQRLKAPLTARKLEIIYQRATQRQVYSSNSSQSFFSPINPPVCDEEKYYYSDTFDQGCAIS